MSDIRAPITGNVWKILEIPVESETSGTVTRVVIAVGDAVTEDDPMFELS